MNSTAPGQALSRKLPYAMPPSGLFSSLEVALTVTGKVERRAMIGARGVNPLKQRIYQGGSS